MQESNGKRQRRASEFVFSRQPSQIGPAAGPFTDTRRHINQSQVAASSPYLTIQSGEGSIQDGIVSPDPLLGIPPAVTSAQLSTSGATHTNATPMRRFHISRNAAAEPVQSQALGVKSQQRPIVFSERRHVKIQKPDTSIAVSFQSDAVTLTTPDETEPDRPRKRPGQAARTPVTPVTPSTAIPKQYIAPPSRNVRLPSGAVMPWDVNSEKLAAEMQAYTLQEIGRSIAQSEANKPKPRTIASPTKFKPKKPALRYHERHPEQALPSGSGMNIDQHEVQDVEMDDDTDYVIDTYIRMPAYQLESDTEDKFGLLVLDSQPDIDEFYKTQIEEEEEEEDFEEDENAENHYSADYPDEEVDSDDEFDRNAHNYYRKDMDDDDDEGAFSDTGDDQRYPWAKSTWTKKKNGSDDEDDDASEDEDVQGYPDMTKATLAQLARY